VRGNRRGGNYIGWRQVESLILISDSGSAIQD
jgi:hypothetical protein